MKYFEKVSGERIYLSPMHMDDAELFTKWMADSDVVPNLTLGTQVLMIENEKEFISSSVNSKDYQFSIIRREDNQAIGNLGLYNVNHLHRRASLGIVIGEADARNKGYGAEAIRLLLQFGFQTLNLQNIELFVYSFNERAIACYKKVGFKEIGRRRKCHFHNVTYYDHIYMDILAEESIKKESFSEWQVV